MNMKSSDYLKAASECLSRTEVWLEEFDPDELDYTPSDGVITMEFADGTRFVLNRQGAASQIWLAAGARAWHFDFDGDRCQWIDDKEGRELFDRISEVVSQKLGRSVRI
jgi:CyaY protein